MKTIKTSYKPTFVVSKNICFTLVLLSFSFCLNAQVTNTTSTGNWSNSGIWDNGIPTDAGTSTVNHNITLDQDIKIEGSCTANSTLTDNAGGNQYKGEIKSSGVFTINADVTFEGEVKFSNQSSCAINSCATLTTANLLLENDVTFYISSCSRLVINGDFKIKNDVVIICDGLIIVNGSVDASNEASISGSGSMTSTGNTSINNNASLFGNTTPCGSTPCTYGTINSIQTGGWNDPSTWDCNCDPANNDNININSSHIVTLTKNETITNLVIKSNGSLDLSNNNWRLNIKKHFTNNGDLIAREGKIKFIGSSQQLIDGTSTTDFFNLHVNNLSGVRVSNGDITIQGALYIQKGCFNTDNKVTLLSNATRTARIAKINSVSCITGDITMQRYIDAGSTNWRFLTSAISGTTLSDFNDDFITSGFTGSDFPLWPTAANPWASIYFYDETQIGIIDSGFVAATSVTNTLDVGEGIWVWSGDTITGTQPFTIDMTGPVNTGDISLPVTYTNTGSSVDDGWNMVGNPYPSTLDWDDASITKANINNAIYIWNPDLQQFASYIAGFGTNGGSKDIASSQAFWVQASAASPSVKVTEESKTTDGGAFLKLATVAPLTINVSNSFGTDQTIINFEANSTNGFDAMFDALKMVSVAANVPSISTLTQGSIDLSINQLPEQEIDIPLKITTGSTGLHQINFTGISNFSFTGCLILEDLFTGNIYDLNTINSITAFIYDTTTTARFVIKFGARVDITFNNASCYGNNDGDILFQKNSPNSFNAVWKDNLGNVVSNNTNVSFSTGINNLSAGTYTIETTDNVCGNRIDSITIIQPAQILAQFTTNTDTIYLSNGGNITFTNQSTNANYYDWDFDDFNTSNLTSPIHQYTQVGSYFVTLNAYQNANCYKTVSNTITVLNTITSINELDDFASTKIWINANSLIIDSEDIDRVEIRNILGQLLFNPTNQKNYLTINLEDLNSQTLIVAITRRNQTSLTKVSYIKK